ncbi:MAG: hypothetical protein EBS07_10025 [Sphingobacteriia bacterium]|nr:hypothetical protein [Sphingobacteriia bacterium]
MVVVSSGCKRGEDDPMFSLKSRDKRLLGAWKITNITAVRDISINDNSNVINTLMEVRFDGEETKLDSTVVTNSATYKRTYTYKGVSYTLNFEKFGILEVVQTQADYRYSGTNITGELQQIQTLKNSIQTYWGWGQDDKDKSNLTIGLNIYDFGPTYKIRQLKSKEIILESIYNDKDEETSPGYTYTNDLKSSITITLTSTK